MKKTLLATTLATITLISASSAFAADSVDLSVGGTIAPIACVPTLSGGGTIDYGDIKADTLKTDDYTVLQTKTLDFSITCDGMTKLAINTVNNRKGTVAGSVEFPINNNAKAPVALDNTNSGVFGLGTAGTKKIGGYSLVMSDTTFDGKAAILINNAYSTSPNSYWQGQVSTTGNSPLIQSLNVAVQLKSWMDPAGDLSKPYPAPTKVMASKISVQAYINKASELDITQPIKLDGSTTLELIYL
ncbi:DUF1120 domain-containing protein [Serratia proteamaculans]|uniref:DUF1120 domain-containing protein n=1 Tax=Serratia proteamaculans TaxID=28151 RepID=UPI0039AEE79E